MADREKTDSLAKEIVLGLMKVVFYAGYIFIIFHWVFAKNPTTRDFESLMFYAAVVIGAEIRDAIKGIDCKPEVNVVVADGKTINISKVVSE